MAVLSLLGLVGLVRARRKRRLGGKDEPVNDAAAKRLAAARETERRMAAYLASRDDGKG